MRFAKKVVVVTGAAQGIGFACAARFAAEGAVVVLSDINAAKCEEAAEALSKRGSSVLWKAADVGVKSDAEALIKVATGARGRLDVLINNAGVLRVADFLDASEDEFDTVLRTNLKSAFLCGQFAARQMVKQRSGVIINMSSVNAVVALPDTVGYAVSKGGAKSTHQSDGSVTCPTRHSCERDWSWYDLN